MIYSLSRVLAVLTYYSPINPGPPLLSAGTLRGQFAFTRRRPFSAVPSFRFSARLPWPVRGLAHLPSGLVCSAIPEAELPPPAAFAAPLKLYKTSGASLQCSHPPSSTTALAAAMFCAGRAAPTASLPDFCHIGYGRSAPLPTFPPSATPTGCVRAASPFYYCAG